MNAVAHVTAAGSVDSTLPGSSTKPANDPLANEETFLKLLVNQLKNQDPLNPPDTNQFVSQLTSYSQLEQLIGIRQNTTVQATGTDAGSSAATLTSTQKAG